MSAALELVVFDLAGTTMKDTGQVPRAFRAALADHGIAVTDEQLSRLRGRSKREAVEQLLPGEPARADRIHASFREHATRSFRAEGVEPVDGAREVFRTLRARGVRVALATGFDRDVTELLVGALGWRDGVFDAIVCGDDVTAGRPAPYLIFRAMERAGATSVHRVAAVGDTTSDLEAGRNAGVRWNVGVLTGGHDRAKLERAPHTHVLPSIRELLALDFEA
jgi:phosphonatase-like hydrolase